MTSSYFPQGSPEFNYLRHLVLLYGKENERWTEDELLYYVAHLSEDGKPDDWLFDSFLFINLSAPSGNHYQADVNIGTTMAGEGDFFAVCSPRPGNLKDWNDLLDYYFSDGGAIQTLDRTINEVEKSIGNVPCKRNVVLTLPYPHITQQSFGEIEKGSGILNFSVHGQNLMRATNARLSAERWFVDQAMERWKSLKTKHINLLGFYWIFETVYRSWEIDDHYLLKELRKCINSHGLKFLWIPFFSSYNFHLLKDYKKYYFDLAFIQPNFMFYKEGKSISAAVKEARSSGAGIEIEYYLDLNEPIAITNEKQVRFREYLNAGIKYGYMKEAACAYFLGYDSLHRMHQHADPIEREYYEDIYHFIRGDYAVKPYPLVPSGAYFVPRTKVAIALDVGGTNLRAAVVDEYGKIRHRVQQSTPVGRDAILCSISDLIEKIRGNFSSGDFEVAGIGISTGGRVDFKRGIIVDSTAILNGWKDVPVAKILEERFQLPVFVDNDGNCAALAEAYFGKGKGINNFIAVVVGTGIGGGIFVNGEILRGSMNYSSEIGHVSIDAEGPVCSCGGRGCVELYASGVGLVRWAEEKFSEPLSSLGIAGEVLTAQTIGEAADRGNLTAKKFLAEAGEKLGIALSGLINVFNPERIILSGSLVNLGEPYLSGIKGAIEKYAMKPNKMCVTVVLSEFPKDGGILGAAVLALYGAQQE